MGTDGRPIVELEGISKRFPGVQALEGVTLNVLPGEIHAIVGENGAGKSTLINILAGELQPDAGTITFDGQPCAISNPGASQQLGISVVYQELALCPNLTAGENIALQSAAIANGLALFDRRKRAHAARVALAELGMESIRVDVPIGQLNVAQQQLVEIAKAISHRVRLLILDEPNSALTQDETAHLFEILRRLRDDGVGILYVSHRLEEVLQLSDRITVLRDGKMIETLDAGTATVDGLIARMVGREMSSLYHRQAQTGAGESVVLRARDVRSGKHVNGVSLRVHTGELVGIAGLPDSGKDELVECFCGLRAYMGQIEVEDASVQLRSPSTALQHGIAFTPADRRGAGALLTMSVQDNVVASSLNKVSWLGWMRPGRMRGMARDFVRRLDVRTSSLGQTMATLSGGNQQKVILARNVATAPHVLVLHEPTRGIDVGAKAEIYQILQELAAGGVGILIASSELPELIGQCDRILVMHAGQITGEFDRAEAAEEPILACAMGQMLHLPDQTNA